MKIMFLDIDGVLNVIPQGRDEYGAIFHPHFVDNLGMIVDQTGAKIVVSSSWRKSGLKIMLEMWKYRNLPGEVIDVTPGLHLKRGGCIQFFNDKLERHPTERVHGYSIPRGCEISYWMNNESDRLKVESYVIIDDDTDMLLQHKDSFVKCEGNHDHPDHVEGHGLTKINAEKAIQILNR